MEDQSQKSQPLTAHDIDQFHRILYPSKYPPGVALRLIREVNNKSGNRPSDKSDDKSDDKKMNPQ